MYIHTRTHTHTPKGKLKICAVSGPGCLFIPEMMMISRPATYNRQNKFFVLATHNPYPPCPHTLYSMPLVAH